MAKTITMKDAEKQFLKKYNHGKKSRPFSMCDNLRTDFHNFCFNKMNVKMSSVIQILMVRYMMENNVD